MASPGNTDPDVVVDGSKTWRRLPVDRLRLAPWNYKDDDDEIANRLAGNLTQHGQLENLIVRRLPDDADGPLWEVCNGNHRLKKYRHLGVDWAVCLDLGRVSVEEAQLRTVQTNELRYPADPARLADVFADTVAAFGLDHVRLSTPLTDEEIAELGAQTRWSWDDYQRRSTMTLAMTGAQRAALERYTESLGLTEPDGARRLGEALGRLAGHFLRGDAHG